MSLLTEHRSDRSAKRSFHWLTCFSHPLASPQVATSTSQAYKNRMKQNVENLDEQYTWYLIPNASIERPKKGRTIFFDAPRREKPHPVIVIGAITSTPEGRVTCFVRSSTCPSSIKHYEHTKCVKTCKLDRVGYLDSKFSWSVPEAQCNSTTFSCEEPSDSYLFDEIEESFPWFK